jgi:hypothetical protein
MEHIVLMQIAGLYIVCKRVLVTYTCIASILLA